MTKFPKQRAACSFVYGDSNFLQTAMILSGVTTLSTCSEARWINVFNAVVPCNNKNISSLLSIKLNNYGNTATIFSKSPSVLVCFNKEHNKSNTCYKIDASTTSF